MRNSLICIVKIVISLYNITNICFFIKVPEHEQLGGARKGSNIKLSFSKSSGNYRIEHNGLSLVSDGIKPFVIIRKKSEKNI